MSGINFFIEVIVELIIIVIIDFIKILEFSKRLIKIRECILKKESDKFWYDCFGILSCLFVIFYFLFQRWLQGWQFILFMCYVGVRGENMDFIFSVLCFCV